MSGACRCGGEHNGHCHSIAVGEECAANKGPDVPGSMERGNRPNHREVAKRRWLVGLRSEAMMPLIRHQPWFFINRWHPDFDRLFGESLGGPTDDTAWTPSVDVHEENDRCLAKCGYAGLRSEGH